MKLLHIFSGVDMRCSHVGLQLLLKKKKITMKETDFVIFLNNNRNLCKMFCGGTDAILYYHKDGRVIDPGVLQYLPKYCGGGKINMDAAIKEHLTDVLARRAK